MEHPKLSSLILSIFIFFTVGYFVFDLIFHVSDGIEHFVQDLPVHWTTALILIMFLIADILIPVPSSVIMVAAGVLFGGFFGGVIMLVGAMTGSILNFLVSRKLGQKKIEQWLGDKQYRQLLAIQLRYGAYIVILTRMMPLIMESMSSIAGISRMSLKKFILLNFIGFAPAAFLYAYTGESFKNEPMSIFAVLIIGFFFPLGIWYFLTRGTRRTIIIY